MGNGLLCCSTGLPMSLTVLLSSPWGLLTPSNDCFPFRNGIFLDKSISCGSSLTLWQISDFSSVFPASLWSHNTPSSSLSAGDAETTGSQQPPWFWAYTQLRVAWGRGDPWLRPWVWVVRTLDGISSGCCPAPPGLSSSPLPMLEGGGGFKVTKNRHFS